MLTVITPAIEAALTTPEAVRLDMGMPSGPALDEAITTAIAQASAAICSWCGRTFAFEVVRESFHHTIPAGVVLLSRSPVVGIVSVTTEAGVLSPDRIEADANGILHLLDDAGLRRRWPAGRVRVDYSAGYILPGNPARTLPHDIERAAVAISRGMIQARGRDTSIRSESTEGIGTTTYGLSGVTGAITDDLAALLAPYRVWGIA